jgi:hypothetical protein
MTRALDRRGITYVLDYEKRTGREPLDVSQKRNFVGFDIISVDRHGKDHRTIEVKSTTGEGIPDAFETEFTRGLRFVATHLYVVTFKKDEQTVDSLHIVPKEEIDKLSDSHRMVQHIKFASALKTRLRNGEFKQPPKLSS